MPRKLPVFPGFDIDKSNDPTLFGDDIPLSRDFGENLTLFNWYMDVNDVIKL